MQPFKTIGQPPNDLVARNKIVSNGIKDDQVYSKDAEMLEIAI